MTGPILRKADRDEVVEMTNLIHLAHAELADRGLNFAGVDQTVATTRRRSFQGSTWVLELEGQLIGMATLSMPPSSVLRELSETANVRRAAWLNQLAVHPDHRGGGHARTLFEKIRDEAIRRRAVFLGLDTARPAEDLREIYVYWGFVEREVIQWPGKEYDSLVMTLALRPMPAMPTQG